MELLQLGAPARGLAGSLNKVEAASHACKPHCLLLQEVWLTEAGESFPSSELALVPFYPSLISLPGITRHMDLTARPTRL